MNALQTSSPTFDPIWETLRRNGLAIPRYPFDFVVVFVNRFAAKDRPRNEVRILEVGCGTGNNLWFAAREGYAVTGIDGSASAIEFARGRFAEEKLAGKFDIGDFTDLPYDDGQFDLVIDRGGLVCCGISAGKRAVAEVRRVLRDGGYFLFNPFSAKHSCFTDSDPGEDGLRINIRGAMSGAGQICYYTRQQVDEAIARGWDVVSLEHWEAVDHALPDAPVHAEWRVILRKNASRGSSA